MLAIIIVGYFPRLSRRAKWWRETEVEVILIYLLVMKSVHAE